MTQSQQSFVAEQYAPRANAYVTSPVHSSGADLDQIEAALHGENFARVLDLGCGGGHVSYRASPHVGEVHACDVTETMLKAVEATAAERGLKNIRLHKAPAEKLPFEDGFFDFVLCRFSTHHWQDMEAGIHEARRVLKKSGGAIFVDAIAAGDAVLDTHLQAVELLRDVSHVRDYSMAEWAGAFSRQHFALNGVVVRTLRMEFPEWFARTRPPQHHEAAIRSIQEKSPAIVKEHFAIGADGSFDLRCATFTLAAV